MKKLLILLLVLSSCVVNRYTCNTGLCPPSVTEILANTIHTPIHVNDPPAKGMISPGRICDPPAGITFTPGSVAPKIYWEHNTWNTLLIKSDTVRLNNDKQ